MKWMGGGLEWTACSSQRRLALFGALLVGLLQRFGFPFEKTNQLRGCAADPPRGGTLIVTTGRQNIQNLGENGRVIGVFGIHSDASVVKPAAKQWARRAVRFSLAAVGQGQPHAQPVNGDRSVSHLRAAFRGRRPQSRGPMNDHHRGLVPVAVLTAGAAASCGGHFAIAQKSIDRKVCRMGGFVRHKIGPHLDNGPALLYTMGHET